MQPSPRLSPQPCEAMEPLSGSEENFREAEVLLLPRSCLEQGGGGWATKAWRLTHLLSCSQETAQHLPHAFKVLNCCLKPICNAKFNPCPGKKERQRPTGSAVPRTAPAQPCGDGGARPPCWGPNIFGSCSAHQKFLLGYKPWLKIAPCKQCSASWERLGGGGAGGSLYLPFP